MFTGGVIVATVPACETVGSEDFVAATPSQPRADARCNSTVASEGSCPTPPKVQNPKDRIVRYNGEGEDKEQTPNRPVTDT